MIYLGFSCVMAVKRLSILLVGVCLVSVRGNDEMFAAVPGNVTVLQGSPLSLIWSMNRPVDDIEFCEWSYRDASSSSVTPFKRFLGLDNTNNVGRYNISERHSGWQFINDNDGCGGGLIKKVSGSHDAGQYQIYIELQRHITGKRVDTNIASVNVVTETDLEYFVAIDGTSYHGSVTDTPSLPDDTELKRDQSLVLNVSAPYADDVTIYRKMHIKHCRERSCALQVNASESEKTKSQIIFSIDYDIQGVDDLELKLNTTVQPAPVSSSYTSLVVILGVLFGLAVVIVVIGSLLYALKFRGDPTGEKFNSLRLDQDIQKLESENEDLTNAKDKLEADKEDLKTENTELKADLTKEEEEVKKLKTDISDLNQSHMGEVHVMRLQLSEEDNEIRIMGRDQDTMNTLRTELTEEKRKNTALAMDKNRLMREKELLETTNSGLQNEVNEQDRKTNQKQKNVDKIKQLQERIKQLEGESGKLKQEVRERDGEINRLKTTRQSDASQTKADDDTTRVMSMEAIPGTQVKKKKLDELVKKASEKLHKLENTHIPNWERLDSTYGTAYTKVKSQALLQEIVDLRGSIDAKRANISQASEGRTKLNGSYNALGYTKTDVEKLIRMIGENEANPLYAKMKEIKPTLDTLSSYTSSLFDILSQYREKKVNDDEAFRRLTDAIQSVEDDKDKSEKFIKAERALNKQLTLKVIVKDFREQLDMHTNLVENHKSKFAPYLV